MEISLWKSLLSQQKNLILDKQILVTVTKIVILLISQYLSFYYDITQIGCNTSFFQKIMKNTALLFDKTGKTVTQ